MKLAQRLHHKGWSEAELAHLQKHFAVAEQAKHPVTRFMDKQIYWVFLLCLVVGIVLFASVFFRVLAYLPLFAANVTTALFGAIFALLFAHVLHSLEEVEQGHHALVLIVASVTAIGSSWLVLARSLPLGILFALSFVFLYGYYWWLNREKH